MSSLSTPSADGTPVQIRSFTTAPFPVVTVFDAYPKPSKIEGFIAPDKVDVTPLWVQASDHATAYHFQEGYAVVIRLEKEGLTTTSSYTLEATAIQNDSDFHYTRLPMNGKIGVAKDCTFRDHHRSAKCVLRAGFGGTSTTTTTYIASATAFRFFENPSIPTVTGTGSNSLSRRPSGTPPASGTPLAKVSGTRRPATSTIVAAAICPPILIIIVLLLLRRYYQAKRRVRHRSVSVMEIDEPRNGAVSPYTKLEPDTPLPTPRPQKVRPVQATTTTTNVRNSLSLFFSSKHSLGQAAHPIPPCFSHNPIQPPPPSKDRRRSAGDEPVSGEPIVLTWSSTESTAEPSTSASASVTATASGSLQVPSQNQRTRRMIQHLDSGARIVPGAVEDLEETIELPPQYTPT